MLLCMFAASGCATDDHGTDFNNTFSASEPLGAHKGGLVQDEDTCTASNSTSEFGPVNLAVEDDDLATSVAGIGGEKALFVWHSDNQIVGYDGEEPIIDNTFGIFARVVHKNGTTFTPSAGLDYWINAHAGSAGAGVQWVPDVSAYTNSSSSRVAVVWVSENEYEDEDPTGDDIVASVWTWNNGTLSLTHNTTYDPTSTHEGDQKDPAVAHVWGGQSYIVVWSSNGDVYLSSCGNTGSCSPKEQKVNTTGFENCQQPRVDGFRAGDHEGYFVVVLSCVDTTPDPDTMHRVYYRRYDNHASPLDSALVLVNDNATDYNAVLPDVACQAEDDFVVVYQYDFTPESEVLSRIRRRHVRFTGTDVAADQYVSSTTVISWRPRVTAFREGTRYGVVWMQYVNLGDYDVLIRRYDQSTGDSIDANPIASGGTTNGIQGVPAADVMQCSGGWVIGWSSKHLVGTGSNELYENFGIFRND